MNELLPVPLQIFNVDISQDSEGRYCLNDLHRAFGGEDKYRPSVWLANKATKRLEEDIIDEIPSMTPVRTYKGYGGSRTYAVEDLVYSYAMWVKPRFHRYVVKVFRQVVTQAAVANLSTSELLDRLKRVATYDVDPDQVWDTLKSMPSNVGDRAIEKYMEENPSEVDSILLERAIDARRKVDALYEAGRSSAGTSRQGYVSVKDLSRLASKSPDRMNQILSDAGFQTQRFGVWNATPEGQHYSKVNLKGKSRSSRLMWTPEVLSQIHMRHLK